MPCYPALYLEAGSPQCFRHLSRLLAIYFRSMTPMVSGSEIFNTQQIRQDIQRRTAVTARKVYCLRPGSGGFLTTEQALYLRHR